MNSYTIAGIVFGCTFGGSLLGMLFRRVLPDPHLSSESKDVIKMGTGLVASMAALVLGLLTASAKGTFDTQRSGFQQMGTNVVMLDRVLAHYGPEAKPARDALNQTVTATIHQLWPENGPSAGLDSKVVTVSGTKLYDTIRDLTPQTDVQKAAQSQALSLCSDLGKTRWSLTQHDDAVMPVPLIVMLVFWLSVLFASFGLFSPGNATVVVVLMVCAMSVAGAVFMIVDMSHPFEGLFRLSSTPLTYAQSQLGQ